MLGRVQNTKSHWIDEPQKVQTIPCDANHIYYLVFFDKFPATNSLYPDEMPREPCHDTHPTDL